MRSPGAVLRGRLLGLLAESALQFGDPPLPVVSHEHAAGLEVARDAVAVLDQVSPLDTGRIGAVGECGESVVKGTVAMPNLESEEASTRFFLHWRSLRTSAGTRSGPGLEQVPELAP